MQIIPAFPTHKETFNQKSQEFYQLYREHRRLTKDAAKTLFPEFFKADPKKTLGLKFDRTVVPNIALPQPGIHGTSTDTKKQVFLDFLVQSVAYTPESAKTYTLSSKLEAGLFTNKPTRSRPAYAEESRKDSEEHLLQKKDRIEAPKLHVLRELAKADLVKSQFSICSRCCKLFPTASLTQEHFHPVEQFMPFLFAMLYLVNKNEAFRDQVTQHFDSVFEIGDKKRKQPFFLSEKVPTPTKKGDLNTFTSKSNRTCIFFTKFGWLRFFEEKRNFLLYCDTCNKPGNSSPGKLTEEMAIIVDVEVKKFATTIVAAIYKEDDALKAANRVRIFPLAPNGKLRGEAYRDLFILHLANYVKGLLKEKFPDTPSLSTILKDLVEGKAADLNALAPDAQKAVLDAVRNILDHHTAPKAK